MFSLVISRIPIMAACAVNDDKATDSDKWMNVKYFPKWDLALIYPKKICKGIISKMLQGIEENVLAITKVNRLLLRSNTLLKTFYWKWGGGFLLLLRCQAQVSGIDLFLNKFSKYVVKVGVMLNFHIFWNQILLLSIYQSFALTPIKLNWDKIIKYELLKCR